MLDIGPAHSLAPVGDRIGTGPTAVGEDQDGRNFGEAPAGRRCHDGGMTDSPVLIERRGDVATITMKRPDRRNALSLDMLTAFTKAFRDVGGSDALGVVLAAKGPVFFAGH